MVSFDIYRAILETRLPATTSEQKAVYTAIQLLEDRLLPSLTRSLISPYLMNYPHRCNFSSGTVSTYRPPLTA